MHVMCTRADNVQESSGPPPGGHKSPSSSASRSPTISASVMTMSVSASPVLKLPSPEFLCGCTRETRPTFFSSAFWDGARGSGLGAPTMVHPSRLGYAPGRVGTLRARREATLAPRGSSRGQSLEGSSRGQSLEGSSRGQSLEDSSRGQSLEGSSRGQSLEGSSRGQ